MRNAGRKVATTLGVAATVAALGLASPAVASAAPVPAAAGGAPCGLSYTVGSARWHNCDTNSVQIGSVAFDPVLEKIANQSQCIRPGDTRFLSPTFFIMHSYVIGYGC